MTIRNVTIGDKFKPNNKHLIAEVVDFVETKSLVRNEVTGHICMAKLVNGIATNSFEVAFATVIRNKVNV